MSVICYLDETCGSKSLAGIYEVLLKKVRKKLYSLIKTTCHGTKN